MQWQDEAIIIGTRRHGETSTILEVMTAGHGRHLGLVRGGRSRRLRPVLQTGNEVGLVWRARLDEHLGTFEAEPVSLNAGRLIGSAFAVYGLQLVAAHLRLLPERDPHERLYRTLKLIIGHLDEPAIATELIARFELLILDELGFGLDLSACAATGTTADLVYVSPKSGRAVSREAGLPFADRMLALPQFLRAASGLRADPESLLQAFRLTGFFLARHVWEARGTGEPPARAAFLGAASRPSGDK
jgi:DNA repair protein RecO (recombination protein O)